MTMCTIHAKIIQGFSQRGWISLTWYQVLTPTTNSYWFKKPYTSTDDSKVLMKIKSFARWRKLKPDSTSNVRKRNKKVHENLFLFSCD